MKIARKHETIERKNSELCIVTEYPSVGDKLDFAIVNVSGQYPPSGRAVNRVSDEIVYINKGNCTINVNGEDVSLGAGDVILVEAGDKFIWAGQVELFITCHPAFTIEQHEIVEMGVLEV